MFWSSESNYSGYEKGKYSLALPAGVACFGLLFLGAAVIIGTKFPAVVKDWIKPEVCIVDFLHRNFRNWVDDLDRKVTVSIWYYNITNLQSVISLGQAPKTDLVGPYDFNEVSEKVDVNFGNGAVSFRRKTQFHPPDIEKIRDHKISLINLDYFRRYHGHSVTSCRGELRSNMARVASIWNWTSSETREKWIQLILTNCETLDENLNDTDLCHRISLTDWLASGQLTSVDTTVLWRLVTRILTEILGDVVAMITPGYASSTTTVGGDRSSNCPSTLIDLIANQSTIGHERGSSSAIDCAQKLGALVELMPKPEVLQRILMNLGEYFCGRLLKQLVVERTTPDELFSSRNAVDSAAVADDGNPVTPGVLQTIFGNNDHIYEWKTCVVGWDIDTKMNMEWLSLDNRLVKWNSKSEYFVPPSSKLRPCLAAPPASPNISVVLEGLWYPAIFQLHSTDHMHDQLVHVFKLRSDFFPLDENVGKLTSRNIDITDILKFPALVSPFCGQDNTNFSCYTDVAELKVEPLTGMVYASTLDIQLGVLLPDELRQRFSLLETETIAFPIARVQRISTVTKINVELWQEINRMLAITCGGAVSFSIVAICCVLAAIGMVVRLHWKPLRERQVLPVPQDLQLLNTVKLRKLLGN